MHFLPAALLTLFRRYPSDQTLRESAATFSESVRLRRAHEGHDLIPGPAMTPAEVEKLCKYTEKELVIFGYTRPDEAEARAFARAEVRRYAHLTDRVALLYPMGRVNETYREIIRNEQSEFGDFYFAEYEEKYNNLGLKLMAVLNLFRRVCPYSAARQWVVKVDSDVAFNLPAMVDFADSEPKNLTANASLEKAPLKSLKGKIYGQIYPHSEVNHGTKKNEEPNLPAMNYFPPYTVGPCVMIDMVSAESMLRHREVFPYMLQNDDVMTGFFTMFSDIDLVDDPRILLASSLRQAWWRWMVGVGVGAGGYEAPCLTRKNWGKVFNTSGIPDYSGIINDCDCMDWFCFNPVTPRMRERTSEFSYQCHQTKGTIGRNPQVGSPKGLPYERIFA